MRNLLMIPVMLLGACAIEPTNQDPSPGVTSSPTDDSAGAGAGETFDTPTITGSFITEPNDCKDNQVLFQTLVFGPDSTRDFDVTCHYQFSGGRTFDSCVFVASMPELETVTLTATDPTLGASVTYSETVGGPPSFNASLDVTTSGLSISWQASTTPSGQGTHIAIDPASNVVFSDPTVFFNATGTVSVTEPGTYTVTLDASMPMGDTYCGAQAQQTVVIEGSENPPCGH
jgi:hypothetical protein